MTGKRIQAFRTRLTSGAALVGTFVKTPAPILCEVLAQARLDVICLDAEHAPFGRMEIDSCIAALRAADQPSLVRIGDRMDAEIRGALDSGATGILAPHVTSAEQAAAIARAARFGQGGRGYSGSTRAAEFGARSLREHVDDSNARTAVIVQIEDPAALNAVGEIAAVDGIDGLFIGRMDLAVALGKDTFAPEVMDAVSEVCAAGRKAGVAVGMFTPDIAEVPRWRAAGASLFLLGSEQGFVLSGARQLVAAFHQAGDR